LPFINILRHPENTILVRLVKPHSAGAQNVTVKDINLALYSGARFKNMVGIISNMKYLKRLSRAKRPMRAKYIIYNYIKVIIQSSDTTLRPVASNPEIMNIFNVWKR
jgi:hypothetical protein